MFYSRRSIMVSLAATAAAMVGESVLHAQQPHVSPEPKTSPNMPDPDHPWGLGGHPEKPVDPQVMAKQNQAEVKASVEKLYVLISELKEQVEKSDATLTLSVSVVKKSKEIEKLAKHVKNLARG